MKQKVHNLPLVESNHHKKTVSLFFVAFVAIITFLLFEYIMLKKQDVGSSNKAVILSPTGIPISHKASGTVVQISPDRHILILKSTTIKTTGSVSSSKQPNNNTDQLIPLIPEKTEILYVSIKSSPNNPSSGVKLSTLSDSQIHGLIGNEISLITTDDKNKSSSSLRINHHSTSLV